MTDRRRYLSVIGVWAIAISTLLAPVEPTAASDVAVVPIKYEGYRRCIAECLEVYDVLHQTCTEIPVGETPQDTEDALDCYSSAGSFRAECTSQCRIFDLLLPPPQKKPSL